MGLESQSAGPAATPATEPVGQAQVAKAKTIGDFRFAGFSVSWSAAKDAAELVGKTCVALLAFAYGLGLIVVNAYVSGFGVHGLGLLRFSYVAAGFHAMSALAFGVAGAVVLGIGAFEVSKRVPWLSLAGVHEDNGRPMPYEIPLVANLLGLIALLFSYRALPITEYGHTTRVVVAAIGSGVCAVAAILAFRWSILDSKRAVPRTDRLGAAFVCALTSIVLAASVLAFAVVFGQSRYGMIPANAGGGQPQRVQLLLDLDPEGRAALAAAGVPIWGHSGAKGLCRTGPVGLLYVSDTECILLNGWGNDAERRSRPFVASVVPLGGMGPLGVCGDAFAAYYALHLAPTVALRREMVKGVLYSLPWLPRVSWEDNPDW